MKSLTAGIALSLSLLAGCATTGQQSAASATPEERARCQAMMEGMGLGPQHSHAEERGTIGQTPMNREHARCRKILEQPAGQ